MQVLCHHNKDLKIAIQYLEQCYTSTINTKQATFLACSPTRNPVNCIWHKYGQLSHDIGNFPANNTLYVK